MRYRQDGERYGGNDGKSERGNISKDRNSRFTVLNISVDWSRVSRESRPVVAHVFQGFRV